MNKDTHFFGSIDGNFYVKQIKREKINSSNDIDLIV